ncbi:MAG: Gfo/Idh/MocA family oxidoreductase [Candidatus Sumerlaeota bacterium]|nr:Gfo/Idh/MocA family oxidoreductase [Candidatus Sumerlaeota bacterium]
MNRKETISRRLFLGGTLGTGALLTQACAFPIVPRHVLGRGPRHIPPSQKLRIACVGCGGKGESDIEAVAKTEQIAALCDVDWASAAKTFKGFPNVPKYKDFREMLDKEDKNIDAVTVSTPDHMHAPIALTAMAMGKHVFVQKPLTQTVDEARKMRESAHKHRVCTMMGIQGHAGEGIRLIREWIEAGAIGKVREVQYWTNRPIWPQGIDRPEEEVRIPETMAWDLWLGVAPTRPYNPCYAPFKWRGWYDFGGGALADVGCHMMDAAFWSLDLGMPDKIELVDMSEAHKETFPKWTILTYHFPARGKMPPVKALWYDGNKMPPRPESMPKERKMGESGQFIIGDEGIIFAGMYAEGPRILPEQRMLDFMAAKPEKKYERVKSHYVEWIEACKGLRENTGANFDYAGPQTEMVLLGNLAVRAGKTIAWDGKKMKVTNAPEANQYLRKTYRKEFALPKLA